MINEISPRGLGRIAAIVSLLLIVTAMFAQGYVAETLVNYRDASVTASNILANETLYKAGYTFYLIEMTAQVVMSVLFYLLLKPVSRTGALLYLVIGLTGAFVKLFARVFFIVPVFVLRANGPYGGFDPEQLSSLALVLLRINNEGGAMACAFFGPATFIQGWLMIKSTFFPKWLGWVALIGGISWTAYYWPSFGKSLFMVSALLGILGTVATSVWLLFKGINDERWRAQQALSSTSIWR